MKEFLKAKIGEKMGVTRIGIPSEVYFEARLKAVEGEIAVFEDDKGQLFGLGIERIILVGSPERRDGGEKARPGFGPAKKGK